MSNARFSILQARAVSDKRVSDAQFRSLAALGCYGDKDGWCFPGLKTLGSDLHKSPQAVSKDLCALVEAGYIEKHPRFDKDGSRKSNLYRLKFDPTPSTPEVDTLSTPEVEVNDSINAPPNVKVRATPKATQIPEVMLFRSVTKRYPPRANYDDVIESVSKVRGRLGREVIVDDLLVFFKAWCHRGYKETNLAWLEWAETGQIPVNGNWKAQKFTNEPKAYNGIRDFLQEQSYAVAD